MKKIFAFVLTLTMLFSVMSLSAFAYTINKDDAEMDADDIFGTTAVYFEDATVKSGETVTVDLMLESNPGITYLKVSLTLPEGISITGIASGEIGNVVSEGNAFVFESDETVTRDGCVAKITFTSSAVGKYNITLSAQAANGGDAVTVNGSDCVVTVTPADVIEIVGDVNDDGVVTAADAAVLKLFLATNNITAETVNLDVNKDGVANASDLAVLKQVLAGM